MTESHQLARTIVAHGVGVKAEPEDLTERTLDLYDIQVSRLKAENAALELRIKAIEIAADDLVRMARDKDRGRRGHISNLYMTLAFLAGFCVYLVISGSRSGTGSSSASGSSRADAVRASSAFSSEREAR